MAEPEPQGFPVGPVTAPSSTVPTANTSSSYKDNKASQALYDIIDIAKRKVEANSEPFISIQPPLVGPEPVSLPPTATPNITKSSKVSATAKSHCIAKRDPEADPDAPAFISIRSFTRRFTYSSVAYLISQG